MIYRTKIQMLALLLCVATATQAQSTEPTQKPRSKRAWEVGLGGSLVNWNRVSLTDFQVARSGGYTYTAKNHQAFGGLNLYVARELNPWLYADFQGTLGLPTRLPEVDQKKQTLMAMAGVGLQLRLTPLFKSKYVDPYLRVGVNYLHKDFNTVYEGKMPNDVTGLAHWNATDPWNPHRRQKDKDNFVPLSFGAGVNFWLSNSLGIGLQGEYLMPTDKQLPHFTMGTARLLWRVGGHDKVRRAVNYVEVDKPVEYIVERIVEKVVEKEPSTRERLYDIISNINFDFDKYSITADSEVLLDEAARILKEMGADNRFLITGHTDARGSDAYNMTLSRNRARMVVEALEKRGVPTTMLKSRGVGKRITSMPTTESDDVRRGDRKVTIERVTLKEYWDRLPKN